MELRGLWKLIKSFPLAKSFHSTASSTFSFYPHSSHFLHSSSSACAQITWRRRVSTYSYHQDKWYGPDGEKVDIELSREERKRAVMEKIKKLRSAQRVKKRHMSPEQGLEYRLHLAHRRLVLRERLLYKFMLPPDHETEHDPELITKEQLHALKKIGYRNKNYVPVGRRGIYAGTIQNMHMHWKFHETLQVDLHMFPKEKIKGMAKELARLSGGIVIDIHQCTTVIMYRGKNYKQPRFILPDNLLDKRKALFKSKYLQSSEAIMRHIKELEEELADMRNRREVSRLVEQMHFTEETPLPPQLPPTAFEKRRREKEKRQKDIEYFTELGKKDLREVTYVRGVDPAPEDYDSPLEECDSEDEAAFAADSRSAEDDEEKLWQIGKEKLGMDEEKPIIEEDDIDASGGDCEDRIHDKAVRDEVQFLLERPFRT